MVTNGDDLTATVCGTVGRVNKLVNVTAVSGRYVAQAGDVVVGRVVEISGKRWGVDIGGVQEAVLMLSSVTIPGVQRRHTAEDELNMRTLLAEGDLLSAEVQSTFRDAGVSLQTRTSKFGRLGEGQVVRVPPSLVKRLKHHITEVPGHPVGVVLGTNGLVWLGPRRGEGEDAPPTQEEREETARAAMAVRALARCHVLISPPSVARVLAAAAESAVPARDMLSARFLRRLLADEAARQQAEAGGGADAA